MITLSINGVTIEYSGGRWRASNNGLSASSLTPMLAYIAYLKAEADQLSDDLMSEFFSVQSSMRKMREVNR